MPSKILPVDQILIFLDCIFYFGIINVTEGIGWTMTTSVPKLLSSVWNWIRDFLMRELIYFWFKLEVAVL